MTTRFIHTADLHLGKTYRRARGETERYEDFFQCLSAIVSDAIREKVDFLLIAGDLFHTGQILPRTLARTMETLSPLQEAGIPCVAIEGNHDWIHRRERLSWMEALAQMGLLYLLRPERDADGGYIFAPYDTQKGEGGHVVIAGTNIYGLGYIGSMAGSHVPRICAAVGTSRNILLFHVGVWTYSPVEIGNMKPEEAAPLAEVFDYVALGHGHKPYQVLTPEGRPYAFNPGSPECVNFGEQKYDKGYYLVTMDEAGKVDWEFRRTQPRPMHVLNFDLSGAGNAEEALGRFREQLVQSLTAPKEGVAPLLEIKLVGKVGFHPFELSRDMLLSTFDPESLPLHIELKNQLSLSTQDSAEGASARSLEEIERAVIEELIATSSVYQGRQAELTELALALRTLILSGEEDEELLGLIKD